MTLLPKSLNLLGRRNLLNGLSALSVMIMDTLLVTVLKKKVFNLTSWDDDTYEEDDKKYEYEKPEASKEKFMTTSVFATPPVSSDDRTDQDVSESETEHDWKDKY